MATIFKNDKIDFKEDPDKIDNSRLFTVSTRLHFQLPQLLVPLQFCLL